MSFREQLTRVAGRRTACLIAVALTFYGAPAFADCEGDVATVAKLASATTDPTAHAELVKILKSAEKELWEGDEEECAAKLSGVLQPGSATAGEPGKTATNQSP